MTAPATSWVEQYSTSCLDRFHPLWAEYTLHIAQRRNLGGWIITYGDRVFDLDGNLVDPSTGRDVLRRCVYPDPVAALAAAAPIAETLTVAGRSVQDVLRENAGGQP